ncbi:Uma2 family endonuclease [Dactylosporangium sp. NPDC050688]|uniref:Uma2 family endonuclease n=1 Tax=Dactylosporangium sp. NPDC050688 TaxID=3157217 RepID=UPI0033F58033
MWIVVPSGDLTVETVLSLKRTGEVPVELHEGTLRIPPPHFWWRQKTATTVTRHFRQLGRAALPGIGIRLGERSYRIPDVVVLRAGVAFDQDALLQEPEKVDMVVEVVEPASADEDRLVKPHVYARAGIPNYWIVDRGVVSVNALRADRYVPLREVPLEELLAGGGGLG